MNIRGGGSSLKRRRVSSIITKGKAYIFIIQETKIKYFKDSFVKSFWNGSDIGFSFSNSNGVSGGLLTLWKGENLEVVNSFKGEGYLGIKVRWENLRYYVINVYSSCDMEKKKLLWDNLLRLKEIFKDGEWIIGGDFNAIKNVRERRGRAAVVNHNESRLFADFIHNSSLVDMSYKGKKYTWYSGDGKSMSRIDRFLISEEVMDRWEWNNMEVEGRGDFVLKEKLKLLKVKLKWWNVEVFGRYDLRVEEDVRNINMYDELLESRNEDMIKEVIKERRRINHIGPILSSRGILESVGEVKEEVFRHFKDKLKEEEIYRLVLDGIHFNNIIESDSALLESPFLEEEIKEAIWSCGGSKSPGPDGYSFLFFKRCWSFLKDDVVRFFKSFYEDGSLSKAVTSSFISLISKSLNRLSLDDYRPICLVGSMYKVVTKLLAGRLKRILGTIVSPCQSAFVPGRQMLEGVVVANEVVDFARKEGKDCLLFKVDFEKAYDKVNWNFLRYMFRKMGFGAKWRGWMEKLVFKSHMLILVNGSPTEDFEVGKWLRQGDPLSPFLFVLVAEGLTGLVRKSIEVGEFDFFSINRSCAVDILQFADDTLLVGKGNWKHVWAIKAALKAFELVSGLCINYHKSKLIGININSGFLEAASIVLSCKIEDSNFYFLGIPVGFNPRKAKTWEPLLSKMRNRLAGIWGSWTLKDCGSLLKISGVHQLRIQSRFHVKAIRVTTLKQRFSLEIEDYGKMPAKVAKEFTRLQSGFLWGEERRGDVFIGLLGGRFLIHNGFNTSFWDVKWLNGMVLKEEFPSLSEASCLKTVSVAAMGGWVDNKWIWGDCGISGYRLQDTSKAAEWGVFR
ncbi:uncharacterized protein LOC131637959 [Vicia villosa]|uniref:uncharacterized protein LOC131637959 n=1 Tax=Vicia villosa TaxID=3911 RepID=UPI00273B29D2|nr:uncharacterized protein LOC131637959 [Vicia villosa]